MRLIHRLTALSLPLLVVVAACTASGTTTTTIAEPATSTTFGHQTPTTQAQVTTTQRQTDPTDISSELSVYAVVAEEQSRRLAIVDPIGPCPNSDSCVLAPIVTVELPERPHNLTGAGSVVYATHPDAGSISRVDLQTGDILTVAIGTEPHDIKYVPSSDVLYVTDEAGRKLLTVDPKTLSVLDTTDLPARAHDLAVGDDAIWVTLVGRAELARVDGSKLDLFPTGGSPHDLIVDHNGLIWFSNWASNGLNIFDPTDGTTVEAPAGVTQPHHFAVASNGTVWVSDNGGGTIVGFLDGESVTIGVGPVPHHIVFVGDTLVVAASGGGEAVLVENGQVVARSQLTTGLHGVALVELTRPLAASD